MKELLKKYQSFIIIVGFIGAVLGIVSFIMDKKEDEKKVVIKDSIQGISGSKITIGSNTDESSMHMEDSIQDINKSEIVVK